LRPEHICLGTDPQIIDCLEFSAALRLLDAAEEMAFLALECERIGCKQVGRRIYETYVRRQSDPAAADLYEFYRSVRAVVRALLCAWHLSDDVDAQTHALWDTRARWYLDVAATEIRAAQTALETRT
jgi:aminoglycoside phosphotransferase family enzyme